MYAQKQRVPTCAEVLIIMARYPTPGRVKTRLAREIGNRKAADLYRSFLEHFKMEFASSPFDVEWHYTPRQANFRKIISSDGPYTIRPQPDGDLGQRMYHIFQQSFVAGYQRVVMIGTDAPETEKSIVCRAFEILRKKPVVIQPTFDGGYALVGLQSMADIFTNIPWSTDSVMSATRDRLKEQGLDMVELEPTYDVDTAADLGRLQFHVA